MGLAKGEPLGLGTGEGRRGVEGCSGVEGREEMDVVMVLELVGDVGGVLVMLLLGKTQGLGGRGGKIRWSARLVLEGCSTCEGQTSQRQNRKERDFNSYQFLLRLGTAFKKYF